MGALRRRLPIKYLAKANYALDHGELGFGSKLQTQLAFDQTSFLPTERLQGTLSEQLAQASRFARANDYPLVLKPDQGRIGMGIVKIDGADGLDRAIRRLHSIGTAPRPYLVQKFTTANVEFGVFYVRRQGRPQITGLNRKHFPAVVGDGHRTLRELATTHPRYRDNWWVFLNSLDLDCVPAAGEHVQLSFIGSHTLGCMFTNDTHRLTPALAERVFALCEQQPGFNFGRFDLKASSESALFAGEFVVIEVNGIASLPTHMFDPGHSLRQGYGIFLEHARYLLDCAEEHRDHSMALDSWPTIVRRLRLAHQGLEASHQHLTG